MPDYITEAGNRVVFVPNRAKLVPVSDFKTGFQGADTDRDNRVTLKELDDYALTLAGNLGGTARQQDKFPDSEAHAKAFQVAEQEFVAYIPVYDTTRAFWDKLETKGPDGTKSVHLATVLSTALNDGDGKSMSTKDFGQGRAFDATDNKVLWETRP